jgi:hypothetical protein
VSPAFLIANATSVNPSDGVRIGYTISINCKQEKGDMAADERVRGGRPIRGIQSAHAAKVKGWSSSGSDLSILGRLRNAAAHGKRFQPDTCSYANEGSREIRETDSRRLPSPAVKSEGARRPCPAPFVRTSGGDRDVYSSRISGINARGTYHKSPEPGHLP